MFLTFKSSRDFYNQFPSQLYKCPKCGKMTADPYYCEYCGNQSTNFIYSGSGLTFTIEEENRIETIFRPIELHNSKTQIEEKE